MATFPRLSISGEGGSTGDQEKDANAMLMELDKALRSPKTGEQCEAIVKFPNLFEKYPFPIVINSAFLKLGDVFRVGSNLLRLCVLRITQKTQKHLDKILNVEEFLRKVYSVIHSNDPVARAITLRLLGSTAQIMSERKNVHHSILSGLESHDSVEVEAAVAAAEHFTAQSKSFANSALGQLSDMIEGLATPVDLKLKLLPIFQHMHHEAHTTKKVRELCTDLLSNHPSQGFVLVTLHTLSQLAAKSLTDIPQQVCLLEQYLVEDSRRAVQVLCLQDLALLARGGPHMWSVKNIQCLCQFVLDTPYESLQEGSLRVLNILAQSIAVNKFSTQPESVEMECCTQMCYHGNPQLCSLGTSMMVHMAAQNNQDGSEGVTELREQSCMALETLLAVLTVPLPAAPRAQLKHRQALKVCLHSVVELCRACPTLSDRLIDTICTCLPSLPEEHTVPLCECLLAICSLHNDLLPGLVPDLLQLLNSATSAAGHQGINDSSVLCLITLLFQGCSSEDTLPPDVHSAVWSALSRLDCWARYRAGRQAARYGHCHMAALVFGSLVSKISSEHYYYWISSLRACSQAESCLQCTSSTSLPQFVQSITQAENFYHQGIAAVKAATTPNQSHNFQLEYIRLRARQLQAFTQLFRACCSFRTSPPPAIATSLAVTTGRDIHKCGHVVAQLARCSKEFTELKNDYLKLYQSSFDADSSSLTNVQLLEQTCQLMVTVLDTITSFSSQGSGGTSGNGQGPGEGGNRRSVSPLNEGALPTEHQRWAIARSQVQSLLKQACGDGSSTTLTYQHLQCLERSAMVLCSVPLCLPRHFFQRLQHTQIKLAMSPNPRSPTEPLTVHYDTHLTLKLEGVIESKGPGSQKKIAELRQIKQVKVQVKSTQQSRGHMMSETKYPDSPSNDLTQTVEPHNDYFCCQALLSFPTPGLHQVTIDTAVLDETGMEWNTGPQMVVLVKSYDEAVQRQQQQQYAAQRQQQRAAAVAAAAGGSGRQGDH